MTKIEETILYYLNLSTSYPVTYVSIVVLSFAFAMAYIVGRTYLKFQERRIEFLESLLEKQH